MDVDATAQIFEALLHGTEAQRSGAIAALTDPNQQVDYTRLRLLILDILEREYYPGRETLEDDETYLWTRSWLLNVLGRICADDDKACNKVRRHLDPAFERSYWVQYWTLESLIISKASDLAALAQQILARADEHDALVIMLARAILAAQGNETRRNEMQDALNDFELQWAALRALRVIPIPALIGAVAAFVDEGNYSDATYDAIVALSAVPAESPHAARAARTLANFVARYRRSSLRDGMRTAALKGLGKLKDESVTPLLIEELTADNPAVVREAALALERVVGIQTAAARVVEAAGKAGSDRTARFAWALRWMNRDALVEELEALMVSGRTEQQDVARLLMSEVGGVVAFEKLHARTTAVTQYTTELEKAEEKIRTLFETSIEEAQKGFKTSTRMDIAVFVLGYLLVGVSAGVVLFNEGTLDSWVGIGLTGGVGVLGVLYSILIAKPRRQIVDAVDHLMTLKIIFLGYLRQLHQTDQAYTRRLLEDEPFAASEVEPFSRMVASTMKSALSQFQRLGRDTPEVTVGQRPAAQDTPARQNGQPAGTPEPEDAASET